MNRDEVVFMGAGGEHPGVYAANPCTPEVATILVLPMGQSVYALSRSDGEAWLAAGTRRGGVYRIHCGDRVPTGDSGRPAAAEPVYTGPAALDVLIGPDGLLLVSDTTGGCHLWRADEAGAPVELETRGSVVCALCLVDGTAVGLTTRGELSTWDVTTGRRVGSDEAIAPPRCHGLVRLLYWEAGRVLLYAGSGGELVQHDLQRRHTTVRQAHTGEWYAAALAGESLLTAGRDDGFLRTWLPGRCAPADCTDVPHGITGLTVVSESPLRVLAVFHDGHAELLEQDGRALRTVHRFHGEAYRVVVGATPAALREADRRRTEARANQLADQVAAAIESGDAAATEAGLAELRSIRHPHVALAIQADSAQAADDSIRELVLRRELDALLASTGKTAAGYDERYVQLLCQFWLFGPALAVCQRMAERGETSQDALGVGGVMAMGKALQGRSWLARPASPLEPIVRAFDAMAMPFTGRWEVQAGRVWGLNGASVTASEISGAYERTRSEIRAECLPAATVRSMQVVSAEAVEAREVVVLSQGDGAADVRVEVVLIPYGGDGEQSVVPVVAVVAASPKRDTSAHNRGVLRLITGTGIDQARRWADRVLQACLLSLRRIVTGRSTAFRWRYERDEHAQ